MSSAAAHYISSIMTSDDTIPLKVLLSRFDRAPSEASRFLKRNCQNAGELKVFLEEEHPYFFFVENKKVALYEEELVTVRESSVLYFKDKMKKECPGPIHYMDFKNQHFDEAPNDVSDFIRRFYPGVEFKKFFASRPDVFVVHHDETVFLIEVESVRFFEKYLNRYGPMPFNQFRGHIGHASPHVQKYMNTYCLGQEFQDFLERNNTMFRVDAKGLVHFAFK